MFNALAPVAFAVPAAASVANAKLMRTAGSKQVVRVLLSTDAFNHALQCGQVSNLISHFHGGRCLVASKNAHGTKHKLVHTRMYIHTSNHTSHHRMHTYGYMYVSLADFADKLCKCENIPISITNSIARKLTCVSQALLVPTSKHIHSSLRGCQVPFAVCCRSVEPAASFLWTVLVLIFF